MSTLSWTVNVWNKTLLRFRRLQKTCAFLKSLPKLLTAPENKQKSEVRKSHCWRRYSFVSGKEGKHLCSITFLRLFLPSPDYPTFKHLLCRTSSHPTPPPPSLSTLYLETIVFRLRSPAFLFSAPLVSCWNKTLGSTVSFRFISFLSIFSFFVFPQY